MLAGSLSAPWSIFKGRRIRQALPRLIVALLMVVVSFAVLPDRPVLAAYDGTHTLTVTNAGTGTGTVTSTPAGVSCLGDCTEAYDDGTGVTLTATVSSGSNFVAWGGACTGTSTCVLTMSADRSVTATFNLTPTPTPVPATIAINPSRGSPNSTTVIVNGSNFVSGTYSITYDSAVVGTLTTSGGSWSQAFLVPPSGQGPHTVTVGTLNATFTVEPKITLSLTRGSQGTQVFLTGNGFAAGQAGMPLTFGAEQVNSASADSLGAFNTGFRVPAMSAGTYQVTIGTASPQSFIITSFLRLGTTEGPPGTEVSLTGSGFGANATVTIAFDGKTVRSVTVDSQGSLVTTFQVPLAAGGPRTVGISEGSSGAAESTFTVTPQISLDRLNSSPGSSVTATGTGFAANERAITVTIDQTTVATGISAGRDGSWTASVSVPSLPAGPHTVRASGLLTARGNVPAITLTLGANVSLERSSGPPDTTLNVSGSGFVPGERISITVGDDPSETTTTADAQGQWTSEVAIPPAPTGRLIIKASGFTGKPQETDYSVTPTVSLSQPTGSPGVPLTIEGRGFRASQTDISIKFGAVVVDSPSSNSRGSFSSNFIIPLSPGGSQVIRVAAGNSQFDAPFVITPSISLRGSKSEPGASVTVFGVGFASNERGITVTLDQNQVADGITADAEGSWSASFRLPSLPTGSYSLQGSGSQTSANSVPKVDLSVGADLSLERSSGPPGTNLEVSGAGFLAQESVTVTVGDGLTETNVIANEEGVWTASISIPAAPSGTLVIEASGSSGQLMKADFTVTPGVTPSQPISSPGSSLAIEGKGFGAGQNLSISIATTVVASPTADSQGSWNTSFRIPGSPAGTYSIIVSGSFGELEVPLLLTPALSLSETRAGPGSSVTVAGSGFAANENGISISLDQVSVVSGITADDGGSWSASFIVPSLPADTYTVRASGPETSSSGLNDETLSVVPLLVLSPEVGGPGSAINLTGRGFLPKQRDISINFDGTVVATVLITDATGSFTTSFVVPESISGLHFIGHSASVAGGSEAGFQVTPIISLEQPSGPPGADIAVSGAGFAANEIAINITYDGAAVATELVADGLGSFTASIAIPSSPAGSHVIQASGSALASVANPQENFNVTQSLVLGSSSGSVGESVEVTGLGFAATAPVTLDYGDGLSQVTGETDASGSFRLDFSIPTSTHGDHIIKLVDDEGHQAQATFTVESTPPAAPALLSPESGSSGGLLGGFRPTSKWGPAEDPSGVTYDLQIATDPEFTQVILEKRGLETNFYALTKQEALPRGNYYWRVRALDGASNESPWSEAFEVQSGILPSWLIPLVAVLAVIIVGGSGLGIFYYRRQQRRRAVVFPELARDVGVGPSLPSPGPRPAPALRAPPRLALPSPSRRGKAPSPEDQARRQLVVDFMRSIPLIQVSSDLRWLEELMGTSLDTAPDMYEQVLEGQMDLGYQPGWIRHPTYEEVKQILAGHEFLRSLENFVEAVNTSAVDTVNLLRQVYGDMASALPEGTARVYQWRYVLAVVQHALAWFRGIYLKEPSAEDYIIVNVSGSDDEPIVALHGEESSPFPGPILEGLQQSDALIYSDLHQQLRTNYAENVEARLLAARLVSLEILREQLTKNLEELDQVG